MTFFEQIRANFTKITDLFKRSNLKQFRHELEQRLADLAYTRDFFLKWTIMSSTERIAIIEEASNSSSPLDARSIARLNSASLTDQSQSLQLQAIDNLVNEMRAVLRVVEDELRARNWLPTSFTSENNLVSDETTDPKFENAKKCASAVDPIMVSDEESSQHIRSFTFPFDVNTQLTINIEGNYENHF